MESQTGPLALPPRLQCTGANPRYPLIADLRQLLRDAWEAPILPKDGKLRMLRRFPTVRVPQGMSQQASVLSAAAELPCFASTSVGGRCWCICCCHTTITALDPGVGCLMPLALFALLRCSRARCWRQRRPKACARPAPHPPAACWPGHPS